MDGDVEWSDLAPLLAGITKRLDYIEAQLVHVGNAAGYRFAPLSALPQGGGEGPPDVVELARTGKKIEAIKRYR